MANKFATLNILPNGNISNPDLAQRLYGKFGDLVIWFFHNVSGKSATITMGPWVTGKNGPGTGTPVGDPINWVYPDTAPSLTIANKATLPIIGYVTALVALPTVFSATLTVAGGQTYDPDLEVSPPGTIIGGGTGGGGRRQNPRDKGGAKRKGKKKK